MAVAFFTIPLVGLLQETNWSSLGADLTTPAALEAIRLSIVCSLAAVALAAAFGIPLAWLLARSDIPGRPLFRGLVLLPMVLPPVVRIDLTVSDASTVTPFSR